MNNIEKLDSTRKPKKPDKVELPETLKKRFAELDHVAEDKDISPRLISALKLLARIQEATNGKIIGSAFEARDVWKLRDPNVSADSAPAKTVKRDLKNLVLVGRLHLIGETCPICGHKTREALYSLQPPNGQGTVDMMLQGLLERDKQYFERRYPRLKAMVKTGQK